MTSIETMELIKEYENGTNHQKKLLERKYGRKQIEIIVERHLTNDYLMVDTFNLTSSVQNNLQYLQSPDSAIF